MWYVEVLVANAAFHGNNALTYASPADVPIGGVVQVPLRNRQVLGLVVKKVPAPDFEAKVVSKIAELPPLPSVSLQLLAWMRHYYAGTLGVLAQLFLPTKLPSSPYELPAPMQSTVPLPPLTTDQTQALTQIGSEGMHLLHGRTGSGKTRVYVELAKRSLATGRSALVLTPEIALTPQLEHDFRQTFGNQVVVVHSRLTEATKQKIWTFLLTQNRPLVVLGARSALFSPLKNIGMIIVDEAHEPAYKQDQAPYYHASHVAGKLAQLHGTPLVLGSATPLVADYYLALAKGRPIIKMHQIAAGQTKDKKEVTLVDLRDRKQFSKKSYLSNSLLKALGETLARDEQALLFLNRRGTARIIFCEKCGWQALCPHCDIPLVYHGDIHRMRCHSCNFNAASPASCPECHNTSVIFRGIGTKAIVDEITAFFPDARVMRFDADNKKNERIEQHYSLIKAGSVDVLVGTQTLAKGLDFPKLSLVGVVLADTSLYFPDFSAQERTYQLLSQIIGRVGRGHRAGKVIIQTYNPDSPLLQAILQSDWHSFYNQELEERKAFLFPPFCYLLKLTCRRATAASAERTANQLAEKLKETRRPILVEGPAPAFHEKIQKKYQWQLVIKSRDRKELLDVIADLPSGWSFDIDPMNLL